MKILNLLSSGNIGGIEILCRDIGVYSTAENGFCFLFEGGAIYEQMKEKRLTIYCLKEKRGKFSYTKWKRLCQIAAQYDIVAVHHGDPILKFYFFMLSKKLNKKFVTVVHSCFEEKYFFPDNRLKNWFGKIIFQRSMSVSDKIIFVSNAGKSSYERVFHIPQDKSCVVYNGIGADKLEAGKITGNKPTQTYRISYIGRLNLVKGVDLLIDAVAMLVNRYPLQLSIIGDGEIKKGLEEQVRTRGIESVTTFYGKQIDIIPFLKQTDIFVYPSVCHEVFGISVVEAMAFGKLCVVNRVGGLPEIIHDGENGFLTEEVSAVGIANAIERAILCYQDGRFQNIAGEARITAERFSIHNTVESLQMVYQGLADTDKLGETQKSGVK